MGEDDGIYKRIDIDPGSINHATTKALVRSMDPVDQVQWIAPNLAWNVIHRHKGPDEFMLECIKSPKLLQIPLPEALLQDLFGMASLVEKPQRKHRAAGAMHFVILRGLEAIIGEIDDKGSELRQLHNAFGERLANLLGVNDNDPDIPSAED